MPYIDEDDKRNEQQRAYREDKEEVHPIITILGILLFLILFSALFILMFVR